MKVAYVTPRYGTEVVGGAEYAARMLAERLREQMGWQVEALTTCALDAATWENHYPQGTSDINGVKVTRFKTDGPRHKDFLHTSLQVHAHPKLATTAQQDVWIDQQGPTSLSLIEAIGDSDADAVVFYPYLYHPTVRGLPLVAKRSILHPAAHDEVSIRMSIFARVFAQTGGFVFQTDGERRMVEQLFPIANKPQLLLGLGVDPQPGNEELFRKAYGLEDRPYVVCLGRVDDGKGSRLLATYFAEYKKRHPGPLTLVFVGPVVQPFVDGRLPARSDVVVTGMVSDEEKWGALRGAEALISPSAYEAFSLALVEAWAAEKPVMVNQSCLATREHVERSGGGLWFSNYLTFEAGLRRMLTDTDLAKAFARAGATYVDARFRWPALIERYGHFLEQVASNR